MTRIVCVPLAPQLGRFDANCVLIESGIESAVSAGADVVVLPELATSGYMFSSPDEARACAIAADHEFLTRLSSVAGEATVVVGFAELGPDGHLYNSAAVLDRRGTRVIYRKTHLWDREKLLFRPGDLPPPLIDTRHGRIAVAICYDLEFPELTRRLALAGAELIVAPVNWPLVPRPAGEHPPEQIIAMAAARVNRVFVACTDRHGVERGQEWTAGTTIIGPDGWSIGHADGTLLVADVELADARVKRLTEYADVVADRRPELYA